MIWYLSHRSDPFARDIADRHYNRQSIGAHGFAPPGRCLVLKTLMSTGRAFWITSWPFAEYVKHEWAGAWICSAFRNEGAGLSSSMITDAVAATRYKYGDPPALGMITFVDARKTKGSNVGYCFKCAGFVPCGFTKGGLHAFQLPPSSMPEPMPPLPMGMCP